ncbi:hypothetical protein PR202_gb10111 [Eleusine coracana subsp. coracana]|uniref:Uncharacterized protein n=1 Tax=Eleusine coracana subsp. coracana TaxID=191504 RepID=A0AAV5EJ39_ELECO|nr:hypothetical protein PR202_gb10111 [Eleusine coracana subsp. coracana]
MATAVVVRRPLLAALLPAAGDASRPAGFHVRRRRSSPPLLAVSSDSSKPVASTSSSAGGNNPDEEPPVLPLLQELADCLVLPPKFLSQLPRDLRLDLNDAAFDLSNGPVLDEVGTTNFSNSILGKPGSQYNALEIVSFLSDSVAKNLPSPSLLFALHSVAFGKRLVSAGRRFQSMGQYGEGELKKIAETMIRNGKLLSKRPVVQSDVQAMKEKRKLRVIASLYFIVP